LGVIYLGDRRAGKTHLALELANPQSNYVKVTAPDYEVIKKLLYDEINRETRATGAIDTKSVYDEFLTVNVQLPAGTKQINSTWLDTSGEIWRKYWQQENQPQWQHFLNQVQNSAGILLILPPYRQLVAHQPNAEDFITLQQWCNRFQRWVNFFRYDCPKIRHLLLCLNKADLFCNLNQEANLLGYQPRHSRMNWQQRHDYVYQRFFSPIHSQILTLNQSISGLSVRCFLTSIYNRSLLELPWLYLGSFLSQ
jgi:hypothetical protein